jgi:nitroreductase
LDTMQAILTRRSVRSYTAQPVSAEAIDQVLHAAMQAPSSNNEQPWHFIVIHERAILDAVPTFHPYAAMLPEASVAILVCGDDTLEKKPGRWVIDCSAATENILLAVHAFGLGAAWLGIYPNEQRIAGVNQLVGLPENVHPFALIPIGYPAEKIPPIDRYRADRIHADRW